MIKLHILTPLIALASCAFVPLSAATELPIDDPAQQEAVEQLHSYFEKPLEVQEGRETAIRLEGRKGDKKDDGGFVLIIEDGDVVEAKGNRAGLPDEAFQHFAAFPELKTIILHHNFMQEEDGVDKLAFDGSGIAALKDLSKLEKIVLPGGPFGNPGLAAAAELPQLKELSVFHTRIDDEGLKALEGHPSLESLNIGQMGSEELTQASLESLSTIPNLANLQFRETYATWEGGLHHLTKLKDTLKVLDLNQTVVPDADIEKLREALPNTEIQYDKQVLAKYLRKTKQYSLRRLAKWAPHDVITEAIGEGWQEDIQK